MPDIRLDETRVKFLPGRDGSVTMEVPIWFDERWIGIARTGFRVYSDASNLPIYVRKWACRDIEKLGRAIVADVDRYEFPRCIAILLDRGDDLLPAGHEDEIGWLTDEVGFAFRYGLFAGREDGLDIVSRCYLAD